MIRLRQSLGETRSRQAGGIPADSPVLQALCRASGLESLILFRRTPLSHDLQLLSSGIQHISNQPGKVFQDGLKLLGSEPARTISLRRKIPKRPLIEFTRKNRAEKIFLVAIPNEKRQKAGFLLGIAVKHSPAGRDTLPLLRKTLAGLHNPLPGNDKGKEIHALAGWLQEELARHELELERDYRRHTLTALGNTIAEISRNHDPDNLSTQILKRAVDLIDPADSGCLFLWESGHLRMSEITGIKTGDFRQIRLSPGEGLPGKTFSRARPIRLVSRQAVLATAANLTPENRKIFVSVFQEPGIPTSAISVPLMRNARPMGVLILDTYSRNRAFSDHDLHLLEQFANLSVVALENARLLDQARLRSFILEHTREAVVSFDTEGKIEFFNQGAQDLWGWKGSPRRRRYCDLFDETSRATIREAVNFAKEKKHWQGELTAIRTDGSPHPVLVSISSVQSAKELQLISFITDITERQRFQEMMLQAAKMESLGKLAGGISHDFNNFLGIILGYSAILGEKLKEKQFGLTELDGIQQAANRAADLTSKLLMFSKGRRLTDLQTVHMEQVIQGSMPMVKGALGKGIEVEFTSQKNLPLLQADPVQIEEILVNLALNAKEAMQGAGRVKLATRLVTRSELGLLSGDLPGDPWVLLEVTDNGTGMSPEECRRIFDPFFTARKGEKGIGLGCAMVYGIVRAHGGWIEVESKSGKGTSFKIYLPVNPSLNQKKK